MDLNQENDILKYILEKSFWLPVWTVFGEERPELGRPINELLQSFKKRDHEDLSKEIAVRMCMSG